ncbi:hypothetical protein PCANC_11733 [Puccinia coronata f. sp. avenae]|uniref:Uncharacterized protein n=1 Tax=Puccinia coronata f. sp. avenae TaxID=200324 RepID=A0A2N5STF2_9BASI|nr:hypothetical protein PCANC_11733 [Puccinia coronata f. sp. avenae]
MPMGAHRVAGHTGAHGKPMGSPFHKWVRAGRHFSQFQTGPTRPLRSRAASGWPMGGPSPPNSHPYSQSHQSGIPCSPDSLPPLIIIAKMSDDHFICPISYDSPTNSRVLTLPNCPSSATLQFGPETSIPSSVTMMSGHSDSANSNNNPRSVTLRSVQSDHVSVQSDHAHNNIQVMDVESDNIHTNPPID